jgi:hypothetical protein
MPDRDLPPEPDTAISDEEQAAAERLRADLESSSASSAEAELAQALSAAWEPRDLPAAEHRALLDRALDRRSRRVVRLRPVTRITLGRAAVVALAASVLLALVRPDQYLTTTGPVLAVSRSTQGLFSERFAAMGGETARIDRIAVARAGDLRDNEFAKWGVR